MIHALVLANLVLSAHLPGADAQVIAVSCGYEHSAALRADGTVTAWGSNGNGQATVPAGLVNVTQISLGGYQSLALKRDGAIVQWGDPQYTGTIPPALQGNTREIAAGGYHAIAQKRDSTLLAWGGLVGGMADVPTYKVMKVASGMHTMAAIKLDSTVVAWGLGGDSDYHGTVPAGLREVIDISVGRGHILAVKKDNTVVVWGDSTTPEVKNMPAGLKAKAIAGGEGFSVAVRLDGTVVQWGTIPSGVSMPSNLTNIIAVAAGRQHVLALRDDGALYAWGNNAKGQCTIPSDITAIATERFGPSDLSLVNNSRQGLEQTRIFDPAGRMMNAPWSAASFQRQSVGVPALHAGCQLLQLRSSVR